MSRTLKFGLICMAAVVVLEIPRTMLVNTISQPQTVTYDKDAPFGTWKIDHYRKDTPTIDEIVSSELALGFTEYTIHFSEAVDSFVSQDGSRYSPKIAHTQTGYTHTYVLSNQEQAFLYAQDQQGFWRSERLVE